MTQRNLRAVTPADGLVGTRAHGFAPHQEYQASARRLLSLGHPLSPLLPPAIDRPVQWSPYSQPASAGEAKAPRRSMVRCPPVAANGRGRAVTADDRVKVV